MEEKRPRKRKYFSLVIGLAFIGYGLYRLYTIFTGTEYSNFRLIIAIGFVVLGAADLYRFFNPRVRE